MSQEVSTTQAFQDKMFARIRDQMGDLLSEEDLQKIVEASIQKAFFEPVANHSSYRTTYDDPRIVTLLRGLLAPKVNEAVSVWVAENPEAIERVLKETLQAGIVRMVSEYFNSKTAGPMFVLANQLRDKGLI